ncbi:DUF4097 family beta strand repeat-containing protein [Spirillospora sp. NPDC052269]
MFMRRHLLSLGLAVTGVVAVTACDPITDKTYKDDAALTAKVTAVKLDGITSGSVTVTGGTAKASLARTIHYRDKRPDGPTHRVENGVLVLSGCHGISDCSVSYDIKVPAGLPVTGGTSNGAITLSHVGQVSVTAHSGHIELKDVSGSVTARTSNGRIEGEGLGGPIDVQTSNGAIELTAAKNADVRAKTSNGAITVTVPAGEHYRVTAHTHNGEPDVGGVPNDPSAQHHLDLTTNNGHIELLAA